MKKLTLSVAALSIAISGFCSNPNPTEKTKTPTSKELLLQLMTTTEDIIDWVKEDEFHGNMMTSELSKLYVNALLEILSKAEDLTYTLKDDGYNINCENCDEID